jgi:hypothetical protein
MMAKIKIFWYIDFWGNITSALFPTTNKYLYLLAYLKANENPPHYDKTAKTIWWLKAGKVVVDHQTTNDFHEWAKNARAEWIIDNN